MYGFFDAMARVFISCIFLYRGWRMLIFPRETLDRLVALNIPLVPAVFVIVLSAVLIGAFGLIFGYRTKVSALLLLVVSAPLLFILCPDLAVNKLLLLLFWLCLVGGLIEIIIHGPGSLSFDKRNLVPVKRKVRS